MGAALLILSACGSGSDDAATAPVTDAPTTVDESADLAAADDAVDSETAATDVPPADESVPVDESVSTDAPATDDAADGSEPAGDVAEPETAEAPPEDDDAAEPAEPVATEAPAPEPAAEPVVGGRLFAPEVQPDAQFDGNPFPDLVVDDIGKDAKVNLKNVLPSDRPVLLWAWAPH